jgi:hypothetical protein
MGFFRSSRSVPVFMPLSSSVWSLIGFSPSGVITTHIDRSVLADLSGGRRNATVSRLDGGNAALGHTGVPSAAIARHGVNISPVVAAAEAPAPVAGAGSAARAAGANSVSAATATATTTPATTEPVRADLASNMAWPSNVIRRRVLAPGATAGWG